MELKQRQEPRVLFVFSCLNCTVMELKQCIIRYINSDKRSLNCTVMELKQCIIRYINSDKRSLNCTVMELKQIIR